MRKTLAIRIATISKKIARKIHSPEQKLAAKIRAARMVKALSQDQVFEQMHQRKLIGTRGVVSEWESGMNGTLVPKHLSPHWCTGHPHRISTLSLFAIRGRAL
jgi:hypothetical protein